LRLLPETDQESDCGSSNVRERYANRSRFQALHKKILSRCELERNLEQEARKAGRCNCDLHPLPRSDRFARNLHEKQREQR